MRKPKPRSPVEGMTQEERVAYYRDRAEKKLSLFSTETLPPEKPLPTQHVLCMHCGAKVAISSFGKCPDRYPGWQRVRMTAGDDGNFLTECPDCHDGWIEFILKRDAEGSRKWGNPHWYRAIMTVADTRNDRPPAGKKAHYVPKNWKKVWREKPAYKTAVFDCGRRPSQKGRQ